MHLRALLMRLNDWAGFIHIRHLRVDPSKVRFENEYSWLKKVVPSQGPPHTKHNILEKGFKFLIKFR
jgi:hypothetical protein